MVKHESRKVIWTNFDRHKDFPGRLILLSHIQDAICHDYPKSSYAIRSFSPTAYQPTVTITGSHAFSTERGYHAQH